MSIGGSLYVIFYLAALSHVPSEGSLTGRVSVSKVGGTHPTRMLSCFKTVFIWTETHPAGRTPPPVLTSSGNQ